MAMKNVRIEMPAALADMFLKLCDEVFVGALANSGCDDFLLPDTPSYREVVALIEMEAHDEEGEVRIQDGQLLTQGANVLDAVIKRFREPLE
jgi:hypothetical protein